MTSDRVHFESISYRIVLPCRGRWRHLLDIIDVYLVKPLFSLLVVDLVVDLVVNLVAQVTQRSAVK